MLTGDTLIRQTKNLRRAKEFAPIVRAKLEREFPQIRVNEFTGAGGSLLVRGMVPNQKDVDRIREIVEHMQPPVQVVYQVLATNIFTEDKP